MTENKKKNFFSFFNCQIKNKIFNLKNNKKNDINIESKKNDFKKIVNNLKDSKIDHSKNQISIDQKKINQLNLKDNNENKKLKNNFLIRFKNSLKKTTNTFSSGLIKLFSKKKIDDSIFEQLEEKLLMADISLDTTRDIIKKIKKYIYIKEINDLHSILKLLKKEMLKILKKVEQPIPVNKKNNLEVILIVGVNGVGKTTTIGKLAKLYKKKGNSVMLVAGDTFRSAAVDQLQEWGNINQISVISSSIKNIDPSSVIFNALDIAISKNIDTLIIDTAGRLHNKLNLMKELQKITRVIKKKIIYAPNEILLVIDACTGQNTITQTKLFHEYLGLTGIILTKLDGTAKGGIIFSIANNFKIPIKYIGIGEKESDLREFNSEDFIHTLFENII